jgi:Spy/CpxP family protein refolding chaperone
MKTKSFFSVTFIALMLISSMSLMAQPNPHMGSGRGMKFTDEQKAKIKDIHMASYKEIKALKNQMGELKAKQKTLTTADKPDMNAINANIDEISKVQNKLMKIKASSYQQIRALLTDEQKMIFDSKMNHRNNGGDMRMHGRGRGIQEREGHEDESQHS